MSMKQQIRSSLAAWFWVGATHEIADKMLAGAAIICRHDWDWEICFQGGPLTWLPKDWTLAEDFYCSLRGLLEGPHSMISDFVQSEYSTWRWLWWPSLIIHTLSCLSHSVIINETPCLLLFKGRTINLQPLKGQCQRTWGHISFYSLAYWFTSQM